MSMKEFFILLLGAVLGNIPLLFRRAKDFWSNRQLRWWRDKVSTLDTCSWIVNYYQIHGMANNLYDCKIGNFEKKIPFFSRPEWQTPQVIDANFHTLDFAYSDCKSFPVNNRLIKKRKQRGYTLFNETTLYLDRIEQNESHVKFHVKKCSYFEMASNLIALEDETYACARHRKTRQPALRNQYFSSLSKVEQLMLKPLSLGCTTALILKTETGWEFVLHTRSQATVTYGGKKAVIPNFGLSVPEQYINGSELIKYNFIKEYCEELFNYEELIRVGSSRKIDEKWFYTLPPAKELLDYWGIGVFTLYYSGFGIDAMNGTSNIALTAIINDVKVAENLKLRWEANWEAARECDKEQMHCSDGSPLLEFVDWQSPVLESYLKGNKFQSGSAFTIEKSIAILQSIEKGED